MSRENQEAGNPLVESLVLLLVCTDQDGCGLPLIESELGNLNPAWIAYAIRSLEEIGLITVDQERVRPSPQLKRLAELNILAF
jgi:hypothetical protein